MSTTIGLIAEYNPLHNGHRYQIEEIKRRFEDATIVAVMSGSFTQRGEPAILDKFIRARLAVDGGVDLVIELPFVFATRSAQDFARGGIGILSKLGVEQLAFGSEVDDLEAIKKAAALIDSEETKSKLRNNLADGQAYAKAIRAALATKVGEAILQPNAMLAIEYVRALQSTAIEPLLIKRIGASHDDCKITGSIASASAIRAALPNCSLIENVVDARTLQELRSADLPSVEKMFLPLRMKLINSTAEELRAIAGMNEGLENKIIRAARTASSYAEMIDMLVNRRYTRSRIRRLLLHTLLDLTAARIKQFDGVHYIRVLAFNERGQLILRTSKNSGVPVVTKLAQHLTTRSMYGRMSTLESYQQMLAFDVKAFELRELLCQTPRIGLDFTDSPPRGGLQSSHART